MKKSVSIIIIKTLYKAFKQILNKNYMKYIPSFQDFTSFYLFILFKRKKKDFEFFFFFKKNLSRKQKQLM